MLVNSGRQSSFRYSVLFLRAFCLFFMHFTEENSRCQVLKSRFHEKKKEPEKCGINTIKNNKSFFLYQSLKNPKTQIDVWILVLCNNSDLGFSTFESTRSLTVSWIQHVNSNSESYCFTAISNRTQQRWQHAEKLIENLTFKWKMHRPYTLL